MFNNRAEARQQYLNGVSALNAHNYATAHNALGRAVNLLASSSYPPDIVEAARYHARMEFMTIEMATRGTNITDIEIYQTLSSIKHDYDQAILGMKSLRAHNVGAQAHSRSRLQPIDEAQPIIQLGAIANLYGRAVLNVGAAQLRHTGATLGTPGVRNQLEEARNWLLTADRHYWGADPSGTPIQSGREDNVNRARNCARLVEACVLLDERDDSVRGAGPQTLETLQRMDQNVLRQIDPANFWLLQGFANYNQALRTGELTEDQEASMIMGLNIAQRMLNLRDAPNSAEILDLAVEWP